MTSSVIALLPLNCFYSLCLQAFSVFVFMTLLIVWGVVCVYPDCFFVPQLMLNVSCGFDLWKILLVNLNRSFILPCENALSVTVFACFTLIVLGLSYCNNCVFLPCTAFGCLLICHDCVVLSELLSEVSWPFVNCGCFYLPFVASYLDSVWLPILSVIIWCVYWDFMSTLPKCLNYFIALPCLCTCSSALVICVLVCQYVDLCEIFSIFPLFNPVKMPFLLTSLFVLLWLSLLFDTVNAVLCCTHLPALALYSFWLFICLDYVVLMELLSWSVLILLWLLVISLSCVMPWLCVVLNLVWSMLYCLRLVWVFQFTPWSAEGPGSKRECAWS